MKRFLWIGCISYLLIGLAHVVIGSLLSELLNKYGLTYEDGGRLIFMQFAGFLLGVLFTPRILRFMGARRALFMALCCLTIAQLIYVFLPPWSVMLSVSPIAGLGFGMVEAIIGAMIIGHLGSYKAVAMSRVEIFFGVGALSIPLISGFFISFEMWQLSFLTIAVISASTAVCWRWMSFGVELDHALDHRAGKHSQGAVQASSAPSYKGIKRILLPMLVLFFIFYVGLEMSMANFLPSMLIEQFPVTQSAAAISVTIFWLAMALGRIVAGSLSNRVGYAKFLIWASVGTVLSLCLLLAATTYMMNLVIVFAIGLFMAGIFSIALVYADHLMPGNTDRITSLLIGSGGVGGAVIPLISGWSLDRFDVANTYRIFAGFALLLFIILALAIFIDKATQHKKKSAAVPQ
ncbi:MFS transporter [Paenibacillus eucommiae]|uniref:FHS family glucose/mannose:H+ symporter-like MFS transporter n=1 Tax=Paenibacillus eucommiae TaxID=1355755 RepID=A0ABS4IY47_9BACL|nr:MFS transporter [Paenibacillus eucommiae]MBP1992514.1 FHS family glucose/mannose:H+ symporter-like MFS transporter [Paenibacillus eucommiae]